MRKFKLIFALLIISFLAESQIYEVITYLENDSAIFKTTYGETTIEFFKKDSLDNWFSYANIESNSSEINHYNKEGYLEYREIWDYNTVYCYTYDSLGNEDFSHKTVYYEYDIPTGIPDENNTITITADGGFITIRSIEIIERVKMYNTLGLLLYNEYPNSTTFSLSTERSIVFVRITTTNHNYVKKILIWN